MGVTGIMQPIIENFMEFGKKRRRRGLTFRDHVNIIDTLEAQDHITYDFLLQII